MVTLEGWSTWRGGHFKGFYCINIFFLSAVTNLYYLYILNINYTFMNTIHFLHYSYIDNYHILICISLSSREGRGGSSQTSRGRGTKCRGNRHSNERGEGGRKRGRHFRGRGFPLRW